MALQPGSLFWIFKHQLVMRSPILRFEEAEGGKTAIVIAPRLIEVHPGPSGRIKAGVIWKRPTLRPISAPMNRPERSCPATLPPILPGSVWSDPARQSSAFQRRGKALFPDRRSCARPV